jgi:hypothetical protein
VINREAQMEEAPIKLSKPLTPLVEYIDAFGRYLAKTVDHINYFTVSQWLTSILEVYNDGKIKPVFNFDPKDITDSNWRTFFRVYVLYVCNLHDWDAPSYCWNIDKLDSQWLPIERRHLSPTKPLEHFTKYNIYFTEGELMWI